MVVVGVSGDWHRVTREESDGSGNKQKEGIK